MSGWRAMTLREAGISLIDCDHRTPPASETGYPCIAIPQLKQGCVDLAGFRQITREHFLDWTRKAKPQPHDVILSRRCNPGETAVIPEGLECALGQNLVLLRPDPAKMFPPFLRWLVRGDEWWEQIGKFLNVGAVFDSLKCAAIPNFRIPIPLPEQRAIASVLGALDDKIELNRGMNETLEALAQSLFKAWFVDAAHHGLPKGWRYATIAELCNINSWTLNKDDALDHIEYVNISEVTRGNITNIQSFQRGEEPVGHNADYATEIRFSPPIAQNGARYFLCLHPSPCLIASTGFAVPSPTKASWSLIHAAMTQAEVFEYSGQQADGGSVSSRSPRSNRQAGSGVAWQTASC